MTWGFTIAICTATIGLIAGRIVYIAVQVKRGSRVKQKGMWFQNCFFGVIVGALSLVPTPNVMNAVLKLIFAVMAVFYETDACFPVNGAEEP